MHAGLVLACWFDALFQTAERPAHQGQAAPDVLLSSPPPHALPSLPIPAVVQLHSLPTSGKKADIVARVTEHVQQQ